MIIYAGKRQPDGLKKLVAVRDTDAGTTGLLVGQEFLDGVNWGYSGSGPARLAQIILNHAVRHGVLPPAAVDYAYQFKWDIVASWGDEWKLTDQEIQNWWSGVTWRYQVAPGAGELLADVVAYMRPEVAA